MHAAHTVRRFGLAGSVLLLLALAIFPITPAAAIQPGNTAFQRTWQRTDKPVLDGVTARTWMWGPEANTEILEESYAEAPNGVRKVQYFDKSRMEITDPDADSSSIWYVTNGLLVVELITGDMQVGNDNFESRNPAEVNVAGDADDPNGPAYATFGVLLDVPPRALGAIITDRVDRQGNVTSDPVLAGQAVTVGFIDGITNHAIAAPFWNFMNAGGTVYKNGQFVNEQLFEDTVFATGRPITEAYWAEVKVGGEQREVLMQCFERRCLTYTPGNPDGFVVEAGNVGQHYYAWRYGGSDDPEMPGNDDGEQNESPDNHSPATRYDFLRKWGLPDLNIEFDALVRTAVAPGGETYVTGPGDDQILKFAPDGTLITAWGGTGTSTGQFRTPVGVAVDSRGDVYVADKDNNRIQKFDSNGAFITASQTGIVGSPELGEFNQPWDIAVGPDDMIYVTEIGNRRVQKLTRNLEYQGVFGYTDDGSGGDGDGQFLFPGGVAVGSGGLVYVSDLELDRVQIFDDKGSFVGAFGSSGAGDGELAGPYGLDVLPGGDVYVTEIGNDRIQIFTPEQVVAPDPGTPATSVSYRHSGYLGERTQQFDNPNDIAFHASSTAYVLDAGNKRIKVFEFRSTNPGLGVFELADAWTDATRQRFSFGNPVGIEIGPDGLVYALDDRQAKIKIFAADGAPVDELGPTLWLLTSAPPGQGVPTDGVLPPALPVTLDAPADLTFDHDGFMFVADSSADRILKLDPDGRVVGAFGEQGDGDGQFDSPIGVAVDDGGNIYVADAGNDRVQKFAPDFSFISAWGGSGSDDGQFSIPIDLVVSESRIYVTDGFPNNRVQVFDLDGNFIAAWDGFDHPNGIAVDPHDYLYVSDSQGVIQKFAADGEFLARFGSVGSGDGQLHVDDSAPRLAIDALGNVYAADSGNQRIQVFSPQN